MKESQIVCFPIQEVQLVYKQKFKPSDRPQITTSADSFRVLLSVWNLETIGFIESFKILLLNRAHRVIGAYEVSSGGMCGTVADPKIIFIAALKTCATSIILAHNHPSGNLTPSDSDLQLTQRIKHGGLLLDIQVLDHLIITEDHYFSFADEGLM